MHHSNHAVARWIASLWAFGLAIIAVPLPSSAQSYDVVIAGAGTGGVSAAVEAGRLGMRVALLEETDWIGGQMSAAAVSTMDEGNNLTPPSGIYREFLSRMEAYYFARGKLVSTCYWQDNTHCFEPSATRKILNEMIADVNSGTGPAKGGHVDLILEDRVVRVLSNGNTVTGVVTKKGKTLKSKILIDATEYGDVLPLTPARFRSGKSIGTDHQNSCTQDLTCTMVIKKYPNGVPPQLWMHNPPPDYDKWLPYLKSEWQIDGNPWGAAVPVNFANHNAYRGLPDSSNPEAYVASEPGLITRTVLNWFNDYPTHTDIFDREARKKILCAAKLKTLANLYYLQHELKQTLWSVANDEGYDTDFNRTENACSNIPAEFNAIADNFPAAPYIRESQRLIGEYTLTAGDIRREKQGGISVVGFPDSIAVGDYADDLHACDAPGDFESDLESISNRPPGFRSGPFEVPLRSLIPEKVDGLLAAEKNLSQSRLANGATRLQPITMLTGEAAGALAALAIKQGIEPRAVRAEKVQIALLEAGSILSRQPMPDLKIGTLSWEAAQFAAAREWMTTDGTGFKPDMRLTRGDAAELLSRAFELSGPAEPRDNYIAMYGKPRYEKATYPDVPLYSTISEAVEAWHATGDIPPCEQSPSLFCPNDPVTISEFISAVARLSERLPTESKQDPVALRRGVTAKDSAPVTRADAAIILFNADR